MKPDADLKKINKYLETVGIQNDFTTEQMNIDWVEDINTNPKSHQKHLKPITLEELKETFKGETEVGQLSFDVAFSRTSQEEADNYARFIQDFKDDIASLQGADELINRYDLIPEHVKIINTLNKTAEEPKKLPIDQQIKHDIQSGIMLCKSWGLQSFWVIYGKVNSPVLLKDKIYEDDIYNSIYKDKKGYAYLIIPLLPLNDNQIEFVSKVYDQAYNMGLKENYNLFIPVVYGLDLVNYNEVTESYKEFYTQEEIIERFNQLFETTVALYHYNYFNGIVWDDRTKRFKPTGTNIPTMQQQSKCSILTCLIRAMGGKKAAEMMSKLLNKKYLPFEF
jgi:hypothetical protein